MDKSKILEGLEHDICDICDVLESLSDEEVSVINQEYEESLNSLKEWHLSLVKKGLGNSNE